MVFLSGGADQLLNGVILMVLGMGIVFIFLTILVYVTKLISKIVRSVESKKPQVAAVEQPSVSSPASDAEIAVAIAAAVAKSKS